MVGQTAFVWNIMQSIVNTSCKLGFFMSIVYSLLFDCTPWPGTPAPWRPEPLANCVAPSFACFKASLPHSYSNWRASAKRGRSHWPSALFRSASIVTWGKAAIWEARRIPCSSEVPSGTTRLARPIASASALSTLRPVRIRSIARDWPIKRGSRTVPPSTRGTPHLRQKTPKKALFSQTRISHHNASSSPPATAGPAMAAITGFESCIRVGPIGPSRDPLSSVQSEFNTETTFRFSPSLARETAARSAPLQNAPWSPYNTATLADGSDSNSTKASANAWAVGPSTAFRFDGLQSLTTNTSFASPCRDVLTTSFIIPYFVLVLIVGITPLMLSWCSHFKKTSKFLAVSFAFDAFVPAFVRICPW